MGTLFNTTMYAGMNDISVTTGNADGWVVVPREAVRPAPAPSAPEKKQKKARRSAKRKS